MCRSKKKDVIEPNRRRNTQAPALSSSLDFPFSSDNFAHSSASYDKAGGKSNSYSWSSSLSSRTSLSSLREALSISDQPHVYDFSEITAATRNFLAEPFSSSSTSTSWRCLLRGQSVIIFQRKFRRPIQTRELVERISLICRGHHSSVISLKGVSVSGNYIYLVYDYVSGVNLAKALWNPKNPNFTVLSNWKSRIQIASDVAHGLNYIHNFTGLNFAFVHNHIKSSSIIVADQQPLNAKICHFGTAELCGEIVRDEAELKNPIGSSRKSDLKRSDSNAMKLEGTRGYMAPEFQATAMATQKSDVYAFGVVIMVLVSGQEALKLAYDTVNGGYVRISQIEAARAAVNGGGVRAWVDRRLKDSYPVDVAEKLILLGLECLEEDPKIRPDMGRVTDRISRLFLESESWSEKMGGFPNDFSVSLVPR